MTYLSLKVGLWTFVMTSKFSDNSFQLKMKEAMAVTQCSSTYCSLFYVLEFLLQAAFSTQKIQNVLQVCTVCIAHLSHFTRHLSKVHIAQTYPR